MRNRSRTTSAALSFAIAALVLSNCGGGGSSASAFCNKLNALSVKFAGLQDSPSKSLVQDAASAVQGLVGNAPSQIKAATKTEADAYSSWASSGDDSALQSNAFAAANDQLDTWESVNCKQ